ncbi:hypothetical protein SUGI_0647710 [Cryptomeria japonica]|nr:hypothetical protein SUGI_0647710 [Cryptomeria japonica]
MDSNPPTKAEEASLLPVFTNKTVKEAIAEKAVVISDNAAFMANLVAETDEDGTTEGGRHTDGNPKKLVITPNPKKLNVKK